MYSVPRHPAEEEGKRCFIMLENSEGVGIFHRVFVRDSSCGFKAEMMR